MVTHTKDIHVRLDENTNRRINTLLEHERKALQTTSRKEVSISSVIRNSINNSYQALKKGGKENG